jgi:hypothetical protein
MSSQHHSTVKAEPYPYAILAVKRSDIPTIEKLDAWKVLEFFRIEALLRSRTVQALYKEDEGSDESERKLFKQYGFTWSVLEGSHYHLLGVPACIALRDAKAEAEKVMVVKVMAENAEAEQAKVDEAVASALRGFEAERLARAKAERLAHAKAERLVQADPALEAWLSERAGIRAETERLARAGIHVVDTGGAPIAASLDLRYRYVLIDTAHKPATIVKGLRPLLDTWHKNTCSKALMRWPKSDYGLVSDFRQPHHPSKRPPICDPEAWLLYLNCYDLRYASGLSIGEVSKRVYANYKNKWRKAETAIRRVTALIAAAERNEWPPRIR